jgi:hypothetical protein
MSKGDGVGGLTGFRVLRSVTPWLVAASSMSALPQSIAATGKWLHREFVAARPVFTFFLVAFLLQFLIIKLAVAQFSIPVSAFSKAVVGAIRRQGGPHNR